MPKSSAFPPADMPVPSFIMFTIPPEAICPCGTMFPALSTRVPSLTIPLFISPLMIIPPPALPASPEFVRFITPVWTSPSADTLKLESEAFSLSIRLPIPLLV